jgi:ribA/ribD-fused uncharacterized protein
MRIANFKGEWRVFSNFFVEEDGLSNEHYFQADKFLNEIVRQIIMNAATPRDSKFLASARGQKTLRELVKEVIKDWPESQKFDIDEAITLRSDWEEVKIDSMRKGLARKFSHPVYKEQLLTSGEAELIEGNTWHDNIWGVCTCARCGGQGKNYLGKLLMELRASLS